MDEKDNNEAPKEETPTSDSNQDSGSESIKVNVTESSDNNSTVEPAPSADGEVKLEDIEKSTDTPEDSPNETEAAAAATMGSSEEDKSHEASSDTVTETTTTEVVKPVDNTPGPVPSVQPKMSDPVSPPSEVAQLKKRNKSLKMWLVIFVILLVALVAGGLVYFSQQKSSNQDLEDANAKNAALQQEILTLQQTTAQETTDELNKQLAEEKEANAELTKTVADQATMIEEYQAAVIELQEACGTACDDVDVPTDTSTAE